MGFAWAGENEISPATFGSMGVYWLNMGFVRAK